MVDLGNGYAGITQDGVERLAAPVKQVCCHFFKTRACKLLVKMDRCPVRGHSKILHGNVCGSRGAQLFLSLLCRFLQTLQRDLVFGEVHVVLILDLADKPVDDCLVPVVTAEVVVAVSCLYLDGGESVFILADFQQGNIECTAAKVKDQDAFIFLAFFEAVCQSSSCRLIDDTQYVQPCNRTGIFCSLALCIIKVCRAGDHCIGNRLTEISLCVPFKLHQDLGGYFLRRPLLAVNIYRPICAHVALYGRDRTVYVRHCLALGYFTDQYLAGFAKRHY